jgi:competence protein ComEA
MLAWLERNQFLVLGLAACFLLAGLLAREITRPAPPPAFVIHEADTGDGPVLVHVSGAVAAPGVYQLSSGARVQDALLAAGGAIPEADLDALNLARPLRDGEQVKVPGASRSFALLAPTLDPTTPLDINSATQAQLDLLPGIGEAYSRRIVDSRLVDGPFGSLDDLVTRRVLPVATLEGIRERLTVTAP